MVFSSHVDQPPAKLESGGRPRPRTEQRRCVAAGSGTPGWERWNAELCFTPPPTRRSRQRLSEPHSHPSENTSLENTHRASGSTLWGVPPTSGLMVALTTTLFFGFLSRSRGGRRAKEEGLKPGGWSLESLQVVGSTPGTKVDWITESQGSCCSVFFGSLIQLSLPAGSWVQVVI